MVSNGGLLAAVTLFWLGYRAGFNLTAVAPSRTGPTTTDLLALPVPAPAAQQHDRGGASAPSLPDGVAASITPPPVGRAQLQGQAPESEGETPPAFALRACVSGKAGGAIATHRTTMALVTPDRCASACFHEGHTSFAMYRGDQCWCAAKAELVEVEAASCGLRCGGAPDTPEAASGVGCGGRKFASVYDITDALKPVITFFIEPAKTRSTLFLTGRLLKYSSGRYRYNTVTLNGRLTNPTAFRKQTCELAPGYKVFVGHGELAHRNWPGNATWIVTGDEAGDWGLKRNGKYYGLHGPGGLFKTNESHPLGHIILPKYAKPYFRQYYDERQVDAFGANVRFLPLGSRLEFPDIAEAAIVPASARKYLFNLMAAPTDDSRIRLRDVLKADTTLPSDRSYVRVSDAWHASANNADYVKPEMYAEVMLDSVFALCPKGHSVEQFRLYEAMEAGAIPVMELRGEYLRTKLPADYFQSGILFVDNWEMVPEAMAKLGADVAALDDRQKKLRDWYAMYMASKLREIEVVLETSAGLAGSVCAELL